jgi:hypothetical protein
MLLIKSYLEFDGFELEYENECLGNKSILDVYPI